MSQVRNPPNTPARPPPFSPPRPPQPPPPPPVAPQFVGVIGNVPTLVSETAEEWSLFLEKLEYYFFSNHIEDERMKKAILFANAGSMVLRQVRKLCQPLSTNDISYSTAIDLLTTHYSPKENKWLSRKIFESRHQQPNEPFRAFVADLRLLAKPCEFSDLEEALLQRIILGMTNLALQEKIFAAKSEYVTLDYVIDKGIAAEAAKQDVVSLQHPTDSTMVCRTESVGRTRVTPHYPSSVVCNSCGGPHLSPDCKYRNFTCNYCKRVGHLELVCRTKLRESRAHLPGLSSSGPPISTSATVGRTNANYRNKRRNYSRPTNSTVNVVSSEQMQSSTTEGPDYPLQPYDAANLFLNSLSSLQAPPPIMMQCAVNNVLLNFEVDCGSGHSVIGKDLYEIYFKNIQLLDPEITMRTWSRQHLQILGAFEATVSRDNKFTATLPLIVMNESGQPLLGRSWFSALGITVKQNGSDLVTHTVSAIDQLPLGPAAPLPSYLQEFADVFSPGLGCYTGPPAHIYLKPDATPVFCKPRPVPFALQERVAAELQAMVKANILEPVKHSEWATPTVNIVKRDGSIRICGDYSGTVNPACQRDVHPLPTVDELLSKLSGGKVFAKLDLTHAFLQMLVDAETANILTLTTHKGLFKVRRLCAGLSSAPAIFQRMAETLVAGLEGVIVYMDDLLLQAPTESQLIVRLRAVLSRIQAAGLRLKLVKCIFNATNLEYLGFHISAQGIRPTDEKIRTLLATPTPTNVDQLRSFLGFITYYDRFMPDKATAFNPLYKLLHDGTEWKWGAEHDQCIKYAHQIMTSDNVLALYDPRSPLFIDCDASSVGVGAVLSTEVDGVERPVAYASRTLRASEKNYSQLDREGLAIIFGISKFHMYVYGRTFTLRTDNKPLCGIFRPGKPIPDTLSPRLLRWCLFLTNYDFVLKHRSGKSNANADYFSRLPIPVNSQVEEYPDPPSVLLMTHATNHAILSAEKVAEATQTDPVLSEVISKVLHGRLYSSNPAIQPYLQCANQLSVQKGCLLHGDRVVLPTSLRPQALQLLHRVHQGVVRTKGLARGYFWWPNMGKSPSELLMGRCIRTLLDKCHPAASARPAPEVAPTRNFTEGQQIMFRNYGQGAKWLPGTIAAVLGFRHYRIQTQDGGLLKRHVDQLIATRPIVHEAEKIPSIPQPILTSPLQVEHPVDPASRNIIPTKPLSHKNHATPVRLSSPKGQEIVTPAVPLALEPQTSDELGASGVEPTESVVMRDPACTENLGPPVGSPMHRSSGRVKCKPIKFQDYVC